MVFNYLAFDKWARFLRIIMKNGGPIGAVLKLWRHDTLKEGKLMGTDAFGNKYFENTYYMISRSRWVEYNPIVKWHYDPSQVTAEWYGWLHYKTDRLPTEDCAKYCLMSCPWTRCWLMPHEENLTATEKAYYPYSTTRAHIYVWDGRNIFFYIIFSIDIIDKIFSIDLLPSLVMELNN
ncbi:probable NADH dehydrogenase [ubiquinone] 1 alpha subcomplex subunit 12 [Zerene cesonia]|uniref:probable NADH dehydrogenase [ubiquinone] 1 alpha subcomplex subunit 12 n=1 Tax=Zerene cesonia TaxID=33412 RepID=UPI0018E4DD34|nr:probable NADH dehydrogenase [ubiquinone] 1 alpha subcomplex subunit 12 [Zerene cesonia]